MEKIEITNESFDKIEGLSEYLREKDINFSNYFVWSGSPQGHDVWLDFSEILGDIKEDPRKLFKRESDSIDVNVETITVNGIEYVRKDV